MRKVFDPAENDKIVPIPEKRGREKKAKSLPREEVRQAFRNETEQQLGGGVLLLPQTPLWEEE